MKEITLLTEAWYRDQPYNISFPDSWDVHVLGDLNIPALSTDEIQHQIKQPISGPSIGSIVNAGSRVGIIVDDLTRPTPVIKPITLLINELVQAGISEASIVIVVGSGSHVSASIEDLYFKLGKDILSRYKVVPHNCRENLVDLGRTTRGTPLFINKDVVESDIRIGVGCIYPHPAAGYSGGSKIIAPAVAGAETTRFMHDHLKGAGRRAGPIDTQFRMEIEDIAEIIGLDFVVNMVLNTERNIAGVFCGDRQQAHLQGIKFAKHHYTIDPIADADIVIADMYPFDVDLQFAHDRGFWPLMSAKKRSSKVILAACPKGIGSHDLYPISNTLFQRYTKRIKFFDRRDLGSPVEKITKLHRLYKQKSLKYWVYSTGVREEDLTPVFPNAKLYRRWELLLNELTQNHTSPSTKVAVYRCAPFLIPSSGMD